MTAQEKHTGGFEPIKTKSHSNQEVVDMEEQSYEFSIPCKPVDCSVVFYVETDEASHQDELIQ